MAKRLRRSGITTDITWKPSLCGRAGSVTLKITHNGSTQGVVKLALPAGVTG